MWASAVACAWNAISPFRPGKVAWAAPAVARTKVRHANTGMSSKIRLRMGYPPQDLTCSISCCNLGFTPVVPAWIRTPWTDQGRDEIPAQIKDFVLES